MKHKRSKPETYLLLDTGYSRLHEDIIVSFIKGCLLIIQKTTLGVRDGRGITVAVFVDVNEVL